MKGNQVGKTQKIDGVQDQIGALDDGPGVFKTHAVGHRLDFGGRKNRPQSIGQRLHFPTSDVRGREVLPIQVVGGDGVVIDQKQTGETRPQESLRRWGSQGHTPPTTPVC